MFNLDLLSALEIILRTLLIYLAILAGLRLSGKREIGQMTVFDLVVLLLIANAVQNAMVGPDNSLLGGILAAGTLLLANALVAHLRLRLPWLRRWVEGTPTLLVLHGKVIRKNMHKEGIDEETLLVALREHGIADISAADMAVLEVDGSISVVPVGDATLRGKKPVRFLHR